jgi:hypothetical protein
MCLKEWRMSALPQEDCSCGTLPRMTLPAGSPRTCVRSLGPRASAWRMLGASRGPGEVVGHRVRGQPVGMRRFRPRRWGRSSSNPVGWSGTPSSVPKPRTSEPESTSRVSSGGASRSSGSSSLRRRRRCLSGSRLMCRRRSSVPGPTSRRSGATRACRRWSCRGVAGYSARTVILNIVLDSEHCLPQVAASRQAPSRSAAWVGGGRGRMRLWCERRGSCFASQPAG